MVAHPLTIPAVVAVFALLVGLAEWLHARRVHRIRYLVFGRDAQPRAWTRAAWPLRIAAVALLCWGGLTLLTLSDSLPSPSGQRENETPVHHVVIGLDVSPSMQIIDAGAGRDLSRADRARDVLRSVLERLDMRRGQVSVIAFYSKARPVVVDTFDPVVVDNILDDLPLAHAFPSGQTNLYSVIAAADELSRTWRAGSATLLLVSDGDTLPPESMPKRPEKFARLLVLGVGDRYRGTFIQDHSSRQDRRSLSQLALQMGGEYIDVNSSHVASELLPSGPLWRNNERSLALREWALAAVVIGSLILALLPVALALAGGTMRLAPDATAQLTRSQLEHEPSLQPR